jgi:transcriptional regulator with XRE-family HTH domain
MDLAKNGKFLTELRKGRGWTQQEAADALGVSDKTVSKWECGNGFPDVGMILPIAELYGITADELLRGEYKNSNISCADKAVQWELLHEEYLYKRKVIIIWEAVQVIILSMTAVFFVNRQYYAAAIVFIAMHAYFLTKNIRRMYRLRCDYIKQKGDYYEYGPDFFPSRRE